MPFKVPVCSRSVAGAAGCARWARHDSKMSSSCLGADSEKRFPRSPTAERCGKYSLGSSRNGSAVNRIQCQNQIVEADPLIDRIKSGEVQAVHSAMELQEILTNYASSLVVLFCKARRCRSCKYFNKKFHRVASTHPDTVFLELMCDESEESFKLMEELNVPVVPHFVMYHDGCERTRLSSTSEEKLHDTISVCEQEVKSGLQSEAQILPDT